MTSSHVAVLTGGVALLAAWLSSAAGTVPVPATDSPVGGGVAPAQSLTAAPARLDLAREVARQSARREMALRPRDPVRNPFTLTARTPATSPPSSDEAATPGPAPSLVDSVTAESPTVSHCKQLKQVNS